MGKSQRDKGNRIERNLVNKLKEQGIAAERVPLSGALGGQHFGDIVLPSGDRCEVKGRAASRIFWKLIKKYITGVSYLVLVEDRQPPLVVMHWDDFVKYQKLKGKNVCTHPSKNNEAH
tara:strand:- start:734 stop:1087 length:354 start_codon:yes stop_codon:yes gene_type:complete